MRRRPARTRLPSRPGHAAPQVDDARPEGCLLAIEVSELGLAPREFGFELGAIWRGIGSAHRLPLSTGSVRPWTFGWRLGGLPLRFTHLIPGKKSIYLMARVETVRLNAAKDSAATVAA